MTFKRSLSLLLALLLTGSLLVGCSEAPASGDEKTAEPGAEEETVPEEPEEEADLRQSIPDDLPERDMDGYDFRIITRDREDFVNDVGAEVDLTGDVVNDAIYYRNLAVMDRFNTTISADYDANSVTVIQNTVAAADDAYDLCLGQVILQTAICTNGGYFDWYTDLPYVNLEKPWYIGNAAEALSVKNHAYVMIGEYDLDVLRFTYCMYYNKDIAEQYQLDEIYSVVKEGRWTYDYLHSLATSVYLDLDGNGAKDENDLLALSGDPYSAVVTYQYAFNNPLFTLDAEGVPQLTFDREKAHDIVTRLNALYWESEGSFTQGWGTGSAAWNAGSLLCYTGLFQSATSYRDLEFDFGIIPYPKYDEGQTQYYTMSDGAHGGMMVPITVKNIENDSIILEALNAETYKQVVPAYYDTSLKVKFSRDTESAEMLDMLMDSRVFDFGYMCGDWGLAFVIQNMVSVNKNDTESSYASSIKMSEKVFGKIIDAYLKLDGEASES